MGVDEGNITVVVVMDGCRNDNLFHIQRNGCKPEKMYVRTVMTFTVTRIGILPHEKKNFPDKGRTIYSWADKIRLHGRREKGKRLNPSRDKS